VLIWLSTGATLPLPKLKQNLLNFLPLTLKHTASFHLRNNIVIPSQPIWSITRFKDSQWNDDWQKKMEVLKEKSTAKHTQLHLRIETGHLEHLISMS
jgi:hypothetical protein